MTEAEIVKHFSEAEYANVVESPQWVKRLLEAEKGYFVLYLNNKHIYGVRMGWLRKLLFESSRIAAIWQSHSGAGLLIAPRRTQYVYFIFDEALTKLIGIRGPWDASLTGVYCRRLQSLNPADRIDYEFYSPEYDHDEAALASCPHISDVAEITYGYHSNPRKDEAFLQHKGGDVEQMPFLGISNISPHGYIIGELEKKPVGFLPNSSILMEGDLVVSLFGGNLEKKALGSIGKAAVVDREHSPCFISQIMCSLRVKDEYIMDGYGPFFILLSIRSDYFARQLRRRMRPANKTQALNTLDDFRACRIKIPSEATIKGMGKKYRKLMDSFKEEQVLLNETERL